jgi:hypothetical protein
LFAGVALCEREWNRADGQKQKEIKRASDKMRFDGGVNLPFHFSVVLVDFLNCKSTFWEPDALSPRAFYLGDARNVKTFFGKH